VAIPIGKEWPMNDGKTVFAQLFEHIPMNDFRKAVRRYRGEYKVQKCPETSFFTTLGNTYFYDPALVECMMFPPYLSSFSSSLSRYERPLMART
jgi:hypothetical protein